MRHRFVFERTATRSVTHQRVMVVQQQAVVADSPAPGGDNPPAQIPAPPAAKPDAANPNGPPGQGALVYAVGLFTLHLDRQQAASRHSSQRNSRYFNCTLGLINLLHLQVRNRNRS